MPKIDLTVSHGENFYFKLSVNLYAIQKKFLS